MEPCCALKWEKNLELAVIKYQFRKLLMLLGIIRKSTSARARKTETLRQKRRNLSSPLRRISGTQGFENYYLSYFDNSKKLITILILSRGALSDKPRLPD